MTTVRFVESLPGMYEMLGTGAQCDSNPVRIPAGPRRGEYILGPHVFHEPAPVGQDRCVHCDRTRDRAEAGR